MEIKKILKNTDTVVTESIINADESDVVWGNVLDFKITLSGNNTIVEAETDTDTNGEFTYYIESDFTKENSFFTVIMELSFTNAKFSDGIENIKQTLYGCQITEQTDG